MSKMPTVRLTGLTITPFEFDLVNSPYDISFHLYETDEGLDGQMARLYMSWRFKVYCFGIPTGTPRLSVMMRPRESGAFLEVCTDY